MNTIKFFDEKPNLRKIVTVGGLTSFYQFMYHDVRLILVGEIHDAMDSNLSGEYIQVLNDFINNCENVKIFLESNESDDINNTEQLSFMESVSLLRSPALTFIHADKRHYKEEFIDLFLYFKTLSELPYSQTSHFDNPQFKRILQALAENYNKNFSFSDLFNLLSLEIESLTQLEKTMAHRNIHLSHYIQTCISNLVKALTMAKNVEKEIVFAERGGETNSILNMCIERVEETKSFAIIIELLEMYYLYEIYHFDATLMMDLWQTLHDKKDNKTFIIVSGNTHTEHLANLLKLIAIPVNRMTSEQQESRISPIMLEELLIDSWGAMERPILN